MEEKLARSPRVPLDPITHELLAHLDAMVQTAWEPLAADTYGAYRAYGRGAAVLTLHPSGPERVGYAPAERIAIAGWPIDARERLHRQIAAYDPESELVLCLVRLSETRPPWVVSSRVIMTPPPRVCYARLAAAEGRLEPCPTPWELPVAQA